MMVSRVLAAALIAGGLAHASIAWSQEFSARPVRLLILGPESNAYSQEQLSVLAIQLKTLAERYGYLKVLPGSVADGDTLRQQAGCIGATPECLAEVGKGMSADMVVHSGIQKLPGRFLVVITQIDVSTKKALTQSRQPSDATPEALREAIEKGWVEIFGSTFRSRLKVLTNVPGARVVLDGRKIGKTPLTLDQEFGKGTHTIEVSLAGYQPVQRQIQINASSVVVVELSLEPHDKTAVSVKPDAKSKPGAAIDKSKLGVGVPAGTGAPVAKSEASAPATAEVFSPKRIASEPEKSETPFVPTTETSGPFGAKPFYKQRIFWIAVGVTIVVATVGILYGTSSGKGEGIPSGKGRVLIEF
jgi:hypothetical protein